MTLKLQSPHTKTTLEASLHPCTQCLAVFVGCLEHFLLEFQMRTRGGKCCPSF